MKYVVAQAKKVSVESKQTNTYSHKLSSRSNKLPILLGGFFQNNVGCQNNHLPRVKTKQNGMKKARYLFILDDLE